MRIYVLAMGLLGICSAVEASSANYEVKLRSYPTSAGQCHQTARNLGEQFAQATNLQTISATCHRSEGTGFDIHIAYEAEQPVSIISTTTRSGMATLGSYASELECQTALPQETSVFEEHVGRAPVFAYCYSEVRSTQDPWILQLTAFGEANIVPHLTSFNVFGTPLGYSEATFIAAIANGFLEQGMDTRFIKFRGFGGFMTASVLYYGDRMIKPATKTYAKLRTQVQCQQQLSRLTEVLTGAGAKPLLPFCSEALGVVEVQAITSGEPAPTSEAIESYETYEECEAGRSELISFYRNELHRPIVGGLCSIDEKRKYTVSFVEQTN